MSKSSDELVADRVKARIKQIVEEEISTLREYRSRVTSLCDEVEKKLEGISDSYRDAEKIMGEVGKMNLFGLVGEAVKVVEVEAKHVYGNIRNNDEYDVDVTVGSVNVFNNHPLGRSFRLNRNRKYRLLVAFIEKEE